MLATVGGTAASTMQLAVYRCWPIEVLARQFNLTCYTLIHIFFRMLLLCTIPVHFHKQVWYL